MTGNYEYWVNAGPRELLERPSIDRFVDLVSRHEQESLIKDFAGRFSEDITVEESPSSDEVPRLDYDLGDDSATVSRCKELLYDLDDEDAAVMYGYNIGMGIERAIETAYNDAVESGGEATLRISDGDTSQFDNLYTFQKGAVRAVSLKVEKGLTGLTDAMAVGMIGAYHRS
ncbi:MAG: hypothetical protein SVW02_02185 [Candidatus Nanohaloarchaea archaeon]|nr:hypothetical protein [Candidatus Nanohaloarchaea archaeon]